MIIYLLIFLFGLVVGSFLNCVIYRLEKGGSFLSGRSYCPQCQHQLMWQDLIPILSFLILRGRCRYCQEKISFQYPLVEISTALLFLLIFHQFLILNFKPPTLFYYLITSCLLIIIFVYDLKHYLIPDKIIYPAIVIALIFNFFTPTPNFGVGASFLISKQFLAFNYSILSAFGAVVFFLLIVVISKGKWMGIGDVKLAFLMGLILGFPNILIALFLAFFLGAIIGIGLVVCGRKTLKSEIPFGPFLITSTFIGLFWGNQIINWYLSFFI